MIKCTWETQVGNTQCFVGGDNWWFTPGPCRGPSLQTGIYKAEERKYYEAVLGNNWWCTQGVRACKWGFTKLQTDLFSRCTSKSKFAQSKNKRFKQSHTKSLDRPSRQNTIHVLGKISTVNKIKYDLILKRRQTHWCVIWRKSRCSSCLVSDQTFPAVSDRMGLG